MTKMNINDMVRVKLTPHGEIALSMAEIHTFEVDEEGYTKFHLWELMQVFGQFMFHGNPNLPFETTIFHVDDRV